jgi:hypothetical protein
MHNPSPLSPKQKNPSLLACCGRVLATLLCVGSLVGATCASARVAEERVSARWCAHQYELAAERVPVCSTVRLEHAQLAHLGQQYSEVKQLYRDFAKERGLAFDEHRLRPPALHVVRYEQINDRAAFPRREGVGNILGRYIMGRAWVFVTERALKEGSSHLPHELAHWIQDMHGLQDRDEDESLARAFHLYYEQLVRDRHAKEKAGEKLSCLLEASLSCAPRGGSAA